MPADSIYKALLGGIALLVLIGGVIDLMLFLSGKGTISAWLRNNQEWYWIPAIVVISFVIALGIHLFVLQPLEDEIWKQ